MQERIIDLHCHTTASDGILSPTELVGKAVEREADVIAVTDHDTVSGVAEAVDAAASTPLRVVAGVELSARLEIRNVHMLGLFVDPSSRVLGDALSDVLADRSERAEGIVAKLNDLGYELTMDDVRTHARGDVIARPHIARALVERGYINYVKEAFTEELISDGGKADVPKHALAPVDAVALIRAAGGVAVIAHPAVGHHEGQELGIDIELLTSLRDAGMAGLEVDHPDHPPLAREKLREIADALGLIPTGGSDYHGDPGHAIGRCMTTPEAFAALEAKAGA